MFLHLRENKVAQYEALYGEQLNVRLELKKAAQWLVDNSAKRKTTKGMPRFFGSWLSRAVDSGRGNSQREQSTQQDLSMSSGNPFADGKGITK